jgi:O-antigen/teichoic acid export membrane protein
MTVPAAPVAHGRRVFRNTLVTGAVGVFSLFANFFVIGEAGHHLGRDPYGILTLALAFSVSAGYLSISDLGLQAGVTRFIADADGRGQRERIGEVVSSALAVLSSTAVVAVAILLALSFVGGHLFSIHSVALQNDLHLLFVIFAAEAVFGLPALAFLGVLQGLQRYGWIKVVDLSRQILFTVLALVVLLTGHGVVAFGATMVTATAFAAIGYAIVAHLLCPEMRVSPRLINRAALRPLAGFSAWVFISRINGVIWAQMDTVILSVIVGINVLAGYNFAARLQSAASYPQSLSAAAVVPASANLLALESRVRLRQLLIRGTRYSLELSLPVTIAAMILARPLLIYWVGGQYASFSGPAQLFLTYQLVSCTAGIANTMLVGMGRVRAVTVYVTIAMVMNLGISIALARPLGVSGVIIGTLVGYGITAPLYIRLVLRELSMGVGEFVVQAILPVLPWAAVFAAVVALTAQLVMPASLIAVALCCVPGTLVYIAGVVRFAMTREERSTLFGFLLPASRSR